jgi:Leucine-rich repeat (LRR) protein
MLELWQSLHVIAIDMNRDRALSIIFILIVSVFLSASISAQGSRGNSYEWAVATIELAKDEGWLGLFMPGLNELPPEIGQLTQLQVLDLSGGRLTALPPELAALHDLRVLNLTRNNFMTFPTVITQLQLRVLDMQSNHLTSLPSDFGQLSGIQEFNYWGA